MGRPPFRPTLVVAFGLAAVLAAGIAAADRPGRYGEYVAWADWARVTLEQEAGLASSWDRTGGHFDANQYESPPGLVLGDANVVAATLTGPGVIDRFWMPHFAAAQPFAIRMYFDGESIPRIDSNSAELLTGPFAYFGAPLVTTFAGGQVSYEPIAFRESVRIETQNRSGKWHWYQYSYRRFPAGTDIESFSPALDAQTQAARLAAAAMFQNSGQHPAGPSATATRTGWGSAAVLPGETRDVVDASGPGTIREIRLRMDGATDAELDSLRLRVTYDDADDAAIDAAVSWFFGAGHGRALYRSLPLGTDSPDGFYCYWPMPFHASARVQLANLSAAPVYVDSVFVDVEPGDPGLSAGYLHVTTKDHLRPPGELWNVLANVTGTGHYVGNFLFVRQNHGDHGFLEGDDLVVVDEADSLHGTGVEDAYNGGFYYNWVTNPMPEPEGPSPAAAYRPLNGILRVAKTSTPAFAQADQYRWMIADRVPFRTSLSVAIETQYSLAYSRWQSVVFWYALPDIVSDALVPAAPQRTAHALALSPNPARSTTSLAFSLRTGGPVLVELLDVAGRRVATWHDGPLPAGEHRIAWQRREQRDGVYFVRMSSPTQTGSAKLVLLDPRGP